MELFWWSEVGIVAALVAVVVVFVLAAREGFTRDDPLTVIASFIVVGSTVFIVTVGALLTITFAWKIALPLALLYLWLSSRQK